MLDDAMIRTPRAQPGEDDPAVARSEAAVPSAVAAPPARGARFVAWIRPRLLALGWLAATLALGTSVGATVPRTGLDGSWITAISVAAAENRRVLRDAVFPFGPWGFLERPLLVSRPQFVLGVLFGVAAATAMFCAVYVCVRRVWPAAPAVAGPVAVVVTLVTPLTDPGLRLLCAGAVFAMLVLERRRVPEMSRPLVPEPEGRRS